MRGKCLSPFKLHGSVIARKLAVKREGEKCGRVARRAVLASRCRIVRRTSASQKLRILATPDAQVGCMLRTTTLSQSPQEAEGVAALATQLDEDGVAFVPPPGEKREETLRRFLAARQGDVRKAAAFLKEDAAWRAAQAIDELRAQDAAAVANPNLNPNPSPNPSPNPKRNTYARNRRWFDEQAAAGRRQLLVVGDSLGDLRCAEGVPDSFVVSRPSPSPSPSPAS